jgi:hypothetical protein
MVYEDLRWALLAKELKPKILCKYTFSVCKCPLYCVVKFPSNHFWRSQIQKTFSENLLFLSRCTWYNNGR